MAQPTIGNVSSKITKGDSSKTIPISLIEIPQIIGMPPEDCINLSFNLMKNSFPKVKIYPCTAYWADGLELFQMKTAWKEYEELLKNVGFKPTSKDKIEIAFIPDQLPTESFNNEYGQTFISKMADVVSDVAGDLVQMTGVRSASELTQKALGGMKEQGAILGGLAKGGLAITGEIGNIAGLLKNNKNPMISNIPSYVDRLLAGQKIDFPQVWKNSSYSPTYGITVKLYNFDANDNKTNDQNIVAPLAAILALALPQAETELYSYPFFCRVECPGLFYLPSAGISNITVSKGGEQASLAFNNRITAIDVRIEFQDLFSTLLMFSGKYDKNRNLRTNLWSYLNQIKLKSGLLPIYGDLSTQNPENNKTQKIVQSKDSYINSPTQPTPDLTTTASTRVNTNTAKTEEDLKKKWGGYSGNW